jgi:hypothetical protein
VLAYVISIVIYKPDESCAHMWQLKSSLSACCVTSLFYRLHIHTTIETQFLFFCPA